MPDNSFSWTSIVPAIVKWLGKQTTETILLFCLFSLGAAGMFYGVPWLSDSIGGHLDEINKANQAVMEQVRGSYEDDQERDQQLIDTLLKRHGIAVNQDTNSGGSGEN